MCECTSFIKANTFGLLKRTCSFFTYDNPILRTCSYHWLRFIFSSLYQFFQFPKFGFHIIKSSGLILVIVNSPRISSTIMHQPLNFKGRDIFVSWCPMLQYSPLTPYFLIYLYTVALLIPSVFATLSGFIFKAFTANCASFFFNLERKIISSFLSIHPSFCELALK